MKQALALGFAATDPLRGFLAEMHGRPGFRASSGADQGPLRREDIRTMTYIVRIDRKRRSQSRESAAGKSEGTNIGALAE